MREHARSGHPGSHKCPRMPGILESPDRWGPLLRSPPSGGTERWVKHAKHRLPRGDVVAKWVVIEPVAWSQAPCVRHPGGRACVSPLVPAIRGLTNALQAASIGESPDRWGPLLRSPPSGGTERVVRHAKPRLPWSDVVARWVVIEPVAWSQAPCVRHPGGRACVSTLVPAIRGLTNAPSRVGIGESPDRWGPLLRSPPSGGTDRGRDDPRNKRPSRT